jgi:hypothetical protein
VKIALEPKARDMTAAPGVKPGKAGE